MGFSVHQETKQPNGLVLNMRSNLYAIGVDAHMVERGRPEEHIHGSSKGRSMGLIEIRHSPIRWVNVLRYQASIGTIWNPPTTSYQNVYIVHDPTVYRKRKLKSVRIKDIPLIGQVVGVRWKGNCSGSVMKRINEDLLLNRALVRYKGDIEIRSDPKYRCWAISSSWWTWVRDRMEASQSPPYPEEWGCYETIARHLLESGEK